MLARRLYLWLVISSASLASGCGVNSSMVRSDLLEQSGGVAIELADTPFYPQTTDQCGPSALASVLGAAGVQVVPSELMRSVYIPGRDGSLQIELLAATRSYERIPYLVEPDVVSLLGEIKAGRPVLVFQNLGIGIAPIWHYAVVVGFLPDESKFVLRSGDNKRHLMTISRFHRSWRRADSWGMVVLAPGELPANPDSEAFTHAIAALEAVGRFEVAAAGYATAVKRWPENTIAWLGLGNSNYALGRLDRAETAYSNLLNIEPNNVVALNNLSLVLADRGRIDDAIETIDMALSLTGLDGAMHELITQTRSEIQSHPYANQSM